MFESKPFQQLIASDKEIRETDKEMTDEFREICEKLKNSVSLGPFRLIFSQT